MQGSNEGRWALSRTWYLVAAAAGNSYSRSWMSFELLNSPSFNYAALSSELFLHVMGSRLLCNLSRSKPPAHRAFRLNSFSPSVTRRSDPVYMQTYNASPPFTATESISLTPWWEQTHQSARDSRSRPGRSWLSVCQPVYLNIYHWLFDDWSGQTKVKETIGTSWYEADLHPDTDILSDTFKICCSHYFNHSYSLASK